MDESRTRELSPRLSLFREVLGEGEVMTGAAQQRRGGIRHRIVLVACLVAALASIGGESVPDASAAPVGSFTVVDLGTLGGDNSVASAINLHGQVVGWSATGAGDYRAFSWTRAGGMTDLGAGSSSSARAVSDSGQVVGNACCWRGFSWTEDDGLVWFGQGSWAADVSSTGQVVGFISALFGVHHAFSWTRDGGLVDLGTLPGGSWSEATAVTDTGAVVGFSTTATTTHAFMWTATQGMIDLGSLGGGSVAEAANELGQVVGRAQVSGYNHAFSWTAAAGIVDLGTLTGAESYAVGVNNAGRVVGWSDVLGQLPHAFTWTQSDGMTDLGAGAARDVNDRGQVVGYDSDGAFVWTPAAGVVRCGTVSGGSGGDAVAINERGEIVGYGTTSSGQTHALLWEPADATPPEIVATDIVADATGPGGAIVGYAVTATDETDPSPTVECSPAQGSLFSIGDTLVACTAADDAGNTTSATFTVHVRGAAEQLADLAVAVNGVGPGTSLGDKVDAAQEALAVDDAAGACSILKALRNHLEAQSGKSIDATTALALVFRADRIRAVLSC